MYQRNQIHTKTHSLALASQMSLASWIQPLRTEQSTRSSVTHKQHTFLQKPSQTSLRDMSVTHVDLQHALSQKMCTGTDSLQNRYLSHGVTSYPHTMSNPETWPQTSRQTILPSGTSSVSPPSPLPQKDGGQDSDVNNALWGWGGYQASR